MGGAEDARSLDERVSTTAERTFGPGCRAWCRACLLYTSDVYKRQLPYFPLASGLLTGKHLRGQPAPAGSRIALRGAPIDDATLDRLEALVVFAEDRRITPTDVAIGALLAQPALVSVIAGATSAEQVCSNAAGARWSPSLEDLAELDTIFPPGVLGASVPRQAQRS